MAFVELCDRRAVFYHTVVSKMVGNVKPSSRGELEITTRNDMYLKEGRLNAQLLGRGYAWMDTGRERHYYGEGEL